MFGVIALFIVYMRVLQHSFQNFCLSPAVKLRSQDPFYILIELWRGVKYRLCTAADDGNFFKFLVKVC